MTAIENSTMEQWVRQARSGDRHAFEKLVERHFGMVYAIAYARLGQREAAEELAQEVMLRAHLYLGKIPEMTSFPGWLVRIAHNLATDWQRRNQRVSSMLQLVSLEKSHEVLADQNRENAREQMERREESKALEEAIFKLPVEQREIVLLHFTEGLSQKEIASRLEVHPATVGRHLKKALGALKGSLEPILQETVSAFGPSSRAKVRALSTIGAATGMSVAAKTALAEAAGGTAWLLSVVQSGAGGVAATGGLSGLLKTITASLATGGIIMGKVKVIVILTAAAIGGIYFYHSGSSPNESVTPPASTDHLESKENDPPLTIIPGVGVGELRFGMNRTEMERILGKPERSMGMSFEYLRSGMAVLGSKDAAVGALLFGDMNNPQSPLVNACQYRTDRGIGMKSTFDELIKTYGQPSSVQPMGQSQMASYNELGATFILANDKIIHMTFRYVAVHSKLQDLLIKAGPNIQIRREMAFNAQFTHEQKYLDMFGMPHVNMTQQLLTIEGLEGAVTYVEFPNEGNARQAAHQAGQHVSRRPMRALQYGKCVAVIQAQNLDQFAQLVQHILDR